MKTLLDPRHKKREKIIKKLYELSFYSKNKKTPELVQPILANLDKIDTLIGQCAPEWPIEKLNKIDLAILRLALFELIIERKAPVKVIIDEAIELGKQYGSQNSSKFVNGVLGAVLNKHYGQ
jgi:N utilization substance protein B